MLPIRLRGARTHNLKDLSLTLESGQLVAIVGPSGAGKSSLAFSTLYAEGQRRFIESFSAYARQFLERLERPDMDDLEPVASGIAVDRQGEIRTSRSTLASLTDVADYAKSLWAHLSTLVCPDCRLPVRKHSPQSAAELVHGRFHGARAIVSYRLVVADTDTFLGVREALVADGYRRVRVGDRIEDLDQVRPSELRSERADPAELTQAKKRSKKAAPPVAKEPLTIEVIVDRLSVDDESRTRLVEALEAAMQRSAGHAIVSDEAGGRVELTTGLVCDACQRAFAEPTPGLFSFNSPVGACDSCRGFGRVMAIDWDKVFDLDKTLVGGGLVPWKGKSTEWERGQLKKHAKAAGVPLDVPIKKLTVKQRKWLLEGDSEGYPEGWFGLRGWFKWLESRAYKMHVRVLLSRYRKYDECPACNGTRFKPLSRAFEIDGLSISGFLALPVSQARTRVERWLSAQPEDHAADLLLRELSTRLTTLEDVGLGYLTLDRAGNTLSGGETQRVALTSALGASLTGAMFVLDEPTVGLHPHDVARLTQVVRRLADAGNLVLMVEHDAQMVAIADRVIELGPKAGAEGGRIVFDGTPHALYAADTATSHALRAPAVKARERSLDRGVLTLSGASGNNLKDVTLTLPKAKLSCVTGASGSGKSSLITETLVPAVQSVFGDRTARPLPYASISGLEGITSVVHVDQSPLGRTSRGNPATYVGAWDVIRKRFAAEPLAKERGYGPAMFSFNVEGGRCEACKGQGYETVEMQFLADVSFGCPSCGGRRFVGPVLDVRHRGLDVASLLTLTVSQVLAQFADDRELVRALSPVEKVGLGYLTLSQPLNTLSGGEAQRLKLAEAFASAKPGALVVLDEPTAGLHPSDVTPLLAIVEELLTRGDTVVIVEHDMQLAAQADWIVDLGPGAGEGGGQIVVQGAPHALAQAECGVTAPFLAQALAGTRSAPGLPKLDKVQKFARNERTRKLIVERAREHNLRDVSIQIPSDKLVAVTGPSGSGKSSLAFGVVHAEGQRRFIETLSPYARQYLPQLPRPDVDRVLHVPPTLSLEQRLTRGGGTSTVATITEVAHYLRLLYARVGVPTGSAKDRAQPLAVGEAVRMLQRRFGETTALSIYAPVIEGKKGLHRELLDKAKRQGFSHARIDGRLRVIEDGLALDRYKEHDIDLFVGEAAGAALEELLVRGARAAEGRVLVGFQKEWIALAISEANASTQVVDPRIFSFNTRQGACSACEGKGVVVTSVGRGKRAREQRVVCEACAGTRLSALARAFRVQGKPITHYFALTVGEARAALKQLLLGERELLIAKELLGELDARLAFLERLGLSYLGLDRSADTLSGGETQRVRLAAQLASGLTGVLYVLDEPTIGLHPRDTSLLTSALRDLVQRGNGVLVVEHDLDTILSADHVIDMGPGGGRLGGTIVAQGSPREIQRDPNSMTGRALAFRPQRREHRSLRSASWLRVSGARHHNLKNVQARFPLGRLTAVTGVSGSGKSSLVREVLLPAVRDALGLVIEAPPGVHRKLEGAEQLRRAVEVDQAPIGRTPRSVPATYIGVWDELRRLLAATPEARARGYDASRFSFNTAQGRCPACDGNGALTVEMSFLPDALIPCEACAGMRFSRETLEVEFHGLSAGQILDLEVSKAAELFSAIRNVHTPLAMLSELGLGYLKLGQPSSTLSGGEAQRMKLVSELCTFAEGPTLYVLDEPTTGLHRSDVSRLLTFLERFVARGDSVVVIEHHPDVMLAADYIVDLGPEGGPRGGNVIASGSPEEIAAIAGSHTGQAIREALRLVLPPSSPAPVLASVAEGGA